MAPDASSNPLLTPYTLSNGTDLSMRIVYVPLTRDRAVGTIPQPNAAIYYSQRAHKGALVLSEATCISQEAHGYPDVPGVYTDAQIAAWKPVVEAVHEKGAVFFCQLWHVGRASHQEYQPGGAAPLAPSALPILSGDKVYISTGAADYPVPRAMDASDVRAVVDQFRVAARNALSAGFDGVEVHAANGYLLEQFIKDGPNQRTDAYGGSLANRLRLVMEVVTAVVSEVGSGRVGIRLTPFSSFLDSRDSDPVGTYRALLQQLQPLNLLYVHFVEPRINGNVDCEAGEQSLEPFRRAYKGTFIAAGGFTRATGMAAIESGAADLIAYGRVFLANPDLPRRFELDAPLNKYDRSSFHCAEQVKGYIDYPFLDKEGDEA